VKKKSLVTGNINFLKNVVIIYLFVFSIFSTIFITETISADSNSYYVSTTGNNGNNGLSPATAWATLEYAMTKVSAGDTVYVMAGTYVHDYITSTKCGSAGNWITYTAYGDGEVILDATGSTSTWAGALWLTNVKYVRFSGFTIRDSSSFGMLFEVTTTSNNITIDNCTIYNCSSSGICFQGASGTKTIKDLLVENNTIYNCQNNWYGTRTQEVVTFSVCARFVFRNNYLYDGHIVLVDVKNSCSEGYLYNNQLDTTGTYGFYLDAGATNSNNLSFYNNIAWGSGTGYVLASEAGGTLTDISYYNNIYNGTQNAFKIDNCQSVAGNHLKTNLKYINNVIASGSTAFKFLEADADIVNLTVRNNIVNASGGFSVPYIELENNNVDHNLYNVTSSNYYGANSINGSPCFVDPSNGDFHLLSNSPAIDAGSSDNAPLVDFDGVSRPQGSAVDIGAFEFLSGYDTTPPQISGISIVTSNPLDTNVNFGWENFSCVVTDNVGVDIVLLQIIYPDETTTNFLMIKITGSNTYYSNLSLNQAGNYSYIIQVTDTSNNVAISSSYIFLLSANWDINNDGRCSILDIILVSNQYNKIGSNGWIREDIDNNGVINLLDMSLVSNHYDESWYT